MSHIYKSPFSGQAGELYKLILQKYPQSADELARKMNITRHSIYRLTSFLIEQGMIEKINNFPVHFRPVPSDKARQNYLMKQSEQFTSILNKIPVRENALHKTQKEIYDLSFYKTRDEHIEILKQDVIHARYSIKHAILVLPVGIPSDLMLEFSNAIKRGVDFKIIAQELNKDNISVLKSYKHIGIQLRYETSLTWHLFLIDDNISYISMYNPDNKISQTGVRFVHSGINKEMQLLFNTYWQKGTEPELDQHLYHP